MPTNKRDYHTRDYWARVVKEFEECAHKHTAKDFCKDNGIGYQNFINWRRRIYEEQEDEGETAIRKGTWMSRKQGYFDAESFRQYIESKNFQSLERVLSLLTLKDLDKLTKSIDIARTNILVKSETKLLKEKESTDGQLEEIARLKMLRNLK